ncbi:hypothetical protein GCM10017778_53050 [Streptomyces vinaceus]|nr:hypothetical protein GCM10017778_53050 [Streptomyces vinaceus]
MVANAAKDIFCAFVRRRLWPGVLVLDMRSNLFESGGRRKAPLGSGIRGAVRREQFLAAAKSPGKGVTYDAA